MDAANAAGNSQTPLEDFFRRIAYRKGRPVAIIATARKIAVAIFVMLDKKVPYQYAHSIEKQEKLRKNQIKNLKKKLSKLKLTKKELAEISVISTN
jgi:transposase